MFNKTNCVNKEYLKEKRECYGCENKKNGCEFRHLLVDNDIFLNLLEGKNADKAQKLLDHLGNKFIGYITDVQLGRLIISLIDEQKNSDKPIISDFLEKNIVSNLVDNSLQIIKTEERELMIYQLLEDTEIRCESHDKLNICSAINHKLDLVTGDNQLIDDQNSLHKTSRKMNGYDIKLYKLKEILTMIK